MIRKVFSGIIAGLLIISHPAYTQVTIGWEKTPETYSVLELISYDRGLRLPQLTTVNRDAMTATAAFQAVATSKAAGLTIYNLTTHCWETWNGYLWISLCAPGKITNLGCASITGVNVTEDVAANITASLSYSGLSGTKINLTDGQTLGSLSGLSVVVNGAQTLSAANGNIAIKITGTAVTHGTINVPVSLGGFTCSISVTSTQQGGAVTDLDCQSVTDKGYKVTQGVAVVNISDSLPYSGMTGSDISLTNGLVLGTASGLSVVVNGAQTLSSSVPSGKIGIKITGTATVTGTISIPVTLAGVTCSIDVTSVFNPANLNTGYGTFTGRTCFDVVEINNTASCGTLSGRLSQKVNFNTDYSYPYTFTTSGTVSNIRFYAVDPTGQVIESFSPTGNPNMNLSGSFIMTVNYYQNLNTTARGLSRSQALTATLYVVYNDKANGTGTDRKLQLIISVQDCSCCPGYLALNGEYKQSSGTLDFGTADFNTVRNYFTRTGNDLCFFMTDYQALASSASEAIAICQSGSFTTDPSYKTMGWRLPNIAELGNINSVATNLVNQSTSVQGTTNMSSNPIAGYVGAYYWSTSVYKTGVSYGWSYGQGNTQLVGPSNQKVRCVIPQ